MEHHLLYSNSFKGDFRYRTHIIKHVVVDVRYALRTGQWTVTVVVKIDNPLRLTPRMAVVYATLVQLSFLFIVPQTGVIFIFLKIYYTLPFIAIDYSRVFHIYSVFGFFYN